MASTPSKRRQLDGVAAWSPHPTHRLICAQVGQSLKLTDRKDIEKEEIIRGRAVCTELFQALKYASSKHHDPSDPNKTKVLKHIYVVDMKNVKTWHVTSRCRDRFRSIMQTMELAYPEVAWRTYVVNAPKYLTIIWVVIKLARPRDDVGSLFSARTRKGFVKDCG